MASNTLPQAQPDLLRPEDVAARLSISRGQVYKLVDLGELTPAGIGLGGRVGLRITRRSVDEFVARGGVRQPR